MTLRDAKIQAEIGRVIGMPSWPRPQLRTVGDLRARIDHSIRLSDAVRLYRFISGHATGADHRMTRASELEGLVHGRTLDEFCERNRLVVYEEVLR